MTPVQMAGNGKSVIFKSPAESNNCPLMGGMVSFSAVSQHKGSTTPVQFVYDLSNGSPRNDVATLETEAGRVSLNGRQQYSLAPWGAVVSWRSLRRLNLRPEQALDKDGARLSIRFTGRGRYFIRATNGRRKDVFTGTAVPTDGKVYLLKGLFTSVFTSYSGRSRHDCGNWDTAAEATKALQRVVSSIPP